MKRGLRAMAILIALTPAAAGFDEDFTGATLRARSCLSFQYTRRILPL